MAAQEKSKLTAGIVLGFSPILYQVLSPEFFPDLPK